jgi:SAM-dependent methyltransferase
MRTAMPNINDSFFDGYYKQIWKTIIPEELTIKEVDFMVPYFELKEGSRVLDMMCGYGRHTLALARKGIKVTAVDNLADYLEEIDASAKNEGLPILTVNQRMVDFHSDEQFDLAICMGNSLQFFDAAEIHTILSSISQCLRSGGQLLINSWTLAEIAIKNFKERSWSQIGDLKFLVESSWHFSPSRIETKSTIITPQGDIEEKESVDYIYSLNEMGTLLEAAGLKLREVYSIPGRKKFSIGEPRAYIVAQKS